MRLVNIFFTHLRESRKMVQIDFPMLFSQSEFQVFEYILILFYQYFYIFFRFIISIFIGLKIKLQASSNFVVATA
jgi:hypothetical protein